LSGVSTQQEEGGEKGTLSDIPVPTKGERGEEIRT